jgi:hypothetical protein
MDLRSPTTIRRERFVTGGLYFLTITTGIAAITLWVI